jgi:hypothetical protein
MSTVLELKFIDTYSAAAMLIACTYPATDGDGDLYTRSRDGLKRVRTPRVSLLGVEPKPVQSHGRYPGLLRKMQSWSRVKS